MNAVVVNDINLLSSNAKIDYVLAGEFLGKKPFKCSCHFEIQRGSLIDQRNFERVRSLKIVTLKSFCVSIKKIVFKINQIIFLMIVALSDQDIRPSRVLNTRPRF